ncbi:hypothetical protein Q5P01_002900 [Channa striata]|uniref:Uncharacterized protein n=1 Tax=Channa striata TaxID=64152 RepID=A0AA88NRA3_CHASR|nr:hypothetical protein Q5P01_002900 [Channa striata]
MWLGNSIFYFTIPGQTLFHVLTCVERYMAVVHPITYLGLKKKGPGEVSGDRGRVDQSKQRAFLTIVAITVALFFKVCWSPDLRYDLTHTMCAVGSAAIWLTVPCTLVLPLLFLQRAGKLPGCKLCNTDSE